MIEKKTPNKFFISKNLLFTELPNKEMAKTMKGYSVFSCNIYIHFFFVLRFFPFITNLITKLYKFPFIIKHSKPCVGVTPTYTAKFKKKYDFTFSSLT